LRFCKVNLDYETFPTHTNFYFCEDVFFEIFEDLNIRELEKRKFYLVYDPNLLLIEHMPKIFAEIREKNFIFFEVESKKNNFLTRENTSKLKKLKNLDGGRSNAFLFITSDEKFVIKVLTKKDKKVFLKILSGYFERILSGSKIVKIFGLFTLKPDNIDFIIMENLIPNRENSIIFDLKGSLLNRKIQIPRFPVINTVLKDQNFIDSKIKIKLENKNILHELIQDFEFLSKSNIIDYSLMLGILSEHIENEKEITEDLISLGIIDIFQTYNLQKVSEKQIKSIVYKSYNVSSTDPKKYCERIIKFIQNNIFY
jgi:Phosphatidylinositol-4-phosphate 5-Kinase